MAILFGIDICFIWNLIGCFIGLIYCSIFQKYLKHLVVLSLLVMVLLPISLNVFTVLIFTFVNIYTLVLNKIYLDVPKDVHVFRAVTTILIFLEILLLKMENDANPGIYPFQFEQEEFYTLDIGTAELLLIAFNGILSIDWVNKWVFKLVRFKEKKIYKLEENIDSARVDIEINGSQ